MSFHRLQPTLSDTKELNYQRRTCLGQEYGERSREDGKRLRKKTNIRWRPLSPLPPPHIGTLGLGVNMMGGKQIRWRNITKKKKNWDRLGKEIQTAYRFLGASVTHGTLHKAAWIRALPCSPTDHEHRVSPEAGGHGNFPQAAAAL